MNAVEIKVHAEMQGLYYTIKAINCKVLAVVWAVTCGLKITLSNVVLRHLRCQSPAYSGKTGSVFVRSKSDKM